MEQDPSQSSWRLWLIVVCLVAMVCGLLWRLVDLNIIQRPFLLKQSNARSLRREKIPAYRGMLTDRFGDPLAISTPVDSIWVNPKLFHADNKTQAALASILQISSTDITKKIKKGSAREFIYLKRRVPPNITDRIQALKIPGVFFQREYRRYYPEGQTDAHIIGLTNIDDKGQEGLELAYNSWLSGQAGLKEVVKDRLGHTVADVAVLKKPKQGRDLVLSIDQRIQYEAYRDLQSGVSEYHAKSGSVVVLDVKTGEILAMANVPSYNPNNRPKVHDGRYRNRAVTDVFEPGSTIKAFNIALALESGEYTPDTLIDTRPGWMVLDGYTIKDTSDHGIISLTQLLQKSSNIGAAKVMLNLTAQKYWNLLNRVGFGQRSRSGFPGEASGSLIYRQKWPPIAVASLAFGYGLSVTPLQLAHAYAVLAADGVKYPVTFIKRTAEPIEGTRVIDAGVAKTLMNMLESVVEKGGTGTRAQIPGYRIAGKTGTAYIAKNGSYDRKHYVASFVGIAPVSNPRLVVAVVIKNPQGSHYGGVVAAPVFAKVMARALRLMNIPPDNDASLAG